MKKLLAMIAIAGCGLFVLTGQQPAPPSVFTAAQAEAGRAAYQGTCARCHTDTLRGRDGTGEIPDKIPPLAGANSAFPPFITKWGPRTTKALYTRIQEAVGADRYRDEELCLNLTAYILQSNGARPGIQGLTTASEVEIRSIAPGVN